MSSVEAGSSVASPLEASSVEAGSSSVVPSSVVFSEVVPSETSVSSVAVSVLSWSATFLTASLVVSTGLVPNAWSIISSTLVSIESDPDIELSSFVWLSCVSLSVRTVTFIIWAKSSAGLFTTDTSWYSISLAPQ